MTNPILLDIGDDKRPRGVEEIVMDQLFRYGQEMNLIDSSCK